MDLLKTLVQNGLEKKRTEPAVENRGSKGGRNDQLFFFEFDWRLGSRLNFDHLLGPNYSSKIKRFWVQGEITERRGWYVVSS